MSQSRRRRMILQTGVDPGPTPSVPQTLLSFLVDNEMLKTVNDLHALMMTTFPRRNDFLVALLGEGMAVAAQAVTEAIRARVSAPAPPAMAKANEVLSTMAPAVAR